MAVYYLWYNYNIKIHYLQYKTEFIDNLNKTHQRQSYAVVFFCTKFQGGVPYAIGSVALAVYKSKTTAKAEANKVCAKVRKQSEKIAFSPDLWYNNNINWNLR